MSPAKPLAATHLSGRVALVTGVSRRLGIGVAIANRLVDDGASVLATGWSAHDAEMPWGADPGGTEALRVALDGSPEQVHYQAADLADAATPARLVAAAVERFGAIDIVVANHARSSSQSLHDLTPEELDQSWAVNARSSLLLAQSLLAQRPAGPGGRLILLTSGQHLGPMPDELPYAISKAAVQQATTTLAEAMADHGITVNCVNPGPVDTGYATGASHREIADRFPARRWGQPSDVARLVAWLAGDEAAWITGQTINSEGGFRR